MTLLDKLSSTETGYYCGCACFSSLLTYSSFLPEEEREEYSSFLLSMVEKDKDVFAFGESKESRKERIDDCIEGYRKCYLYIERLSSIVPSCIKRQLDSDIVFLKNLEEYISSQRG